jgi:hypothetical protein
VSEDPRRVELRSLAVKAAALEASVADLLLRDPDYETELIRRVRQAHADAGNDVSHGEVRAAIYDLAEDETAWKPGPTDPVKPIAVIALQLAIERGKEARDRIAYRHAMRAMSPEGELHRASLELSEKTGLTYRAARETVVEAVEPGVGQESARQAMEGAGVRVPIV